MNDYLFALIFTAYITSGIFIVLWMEENYFDAKYGRESSKKWSVWRVLIWPFLLPFACPKIRKAKKQKAEETRQWWAEKERKGRIESVEIPDTVTKIEKYAYQDYDNLKHLFIPASVRKIDPEAFPFENLVLEVAPDNPTYEMRSGHLVTKKDNVLVIGTPKEPIPNTVAEIGELAFICSDELEEVIIPDSVKKIGKEAFCACANLTKVVIPNSVIEIGSGAFDECTSLTEVHLPVSLRKLGLAFDDGPYEGRDIYVHFTDPAQCQVEMLDDESTGWPANWNDRLFVPKGSCQAFEKAEPWCGFETIQEFE
jgi:hypothetical protein